jgi:Carboxypeptidase regulatory-like domain/TonB-dependent Receptor Plug Domain
MRKILLLLALCLTVAVPAIAQVQSGTIAGIVRDEQGAVLPGVTVTLSGVDRSATFVTEADGRFRFLDLPPGTYKLTSDLQGFSRMVHEGIAVIVGQNVDIPITMKVAAVQETLTVTGESPIVDAKAMGTATNFTSSELEKIPTSRDPWALLRTVPGVMVDRVNIAGNETGQQSNFQSKGTRPQDAVWTMDGVVVTDMAAIGASPTYFNYDNFEEVQVSTSGQDLKQPTGGVGLNMVIKRGTNQLRGGFRGYFTNDALEASNVPDELKAIGVTPETADHNEQISDYTAEIGGPIVQNKAWFYGSWANQDIRLVRRSGNLIDRTVLKTFDAKGTWQATSKDMVNVLWYLGAKEKFGRSPGTAGITLDGPGATWDQGGAYAGGPHGLTKIEDNHVFGSNLFLSGRYAYYNTGFGLEPKAGLDESAGESQVLATSFGSTRESLNIRPQHTVNVDGSSFHSGWGGAHEFKFGGGYRRVDVTTGTLWPGNMLRALNNSPTNNVVRLYREGLGTDRVEFFNLYLGDTISRGPLTIEAGFRYDRQWGAALASETRANAAFPDIVPGISFAGYDAPFTWNDISPRIGATWALDEGRKTILRASFNRTAGQLESGIVGYSNLSANPGFAEYGWNDVNGDHLAEPSEVDFSDFRTVGGGFDQANPTSVESVDVVDPNLKAPHTSAFVAGIDRELMPNLAISAAYTYTRTTDLNGTFTLFYTPWIGLTPADYAPGDPLTGTLPDGSSYNIPTFIPNEDKVAAVNFGTVLSNYPGYHSYYNGIEFTLTKRLSNKWMARVGGAWNSPNEHYDVPVNEQGNPTRTDTTPLVNGGAFTVRSGGSGSGDIFIHSKWQINANGLYEAPWGINLAGNLFGRQGYPFPIYRNAALGVDSTRRVLVTPELDTFRLDNLWDLDVRASKVFRLERMNIEAIADLFNVMNANTELVRNRNAGSTTFNQLVQNLSPRILRFGVRVTF